MKKMLLVLFSIIVIGIVITGCNAKDENLSEKSKEVTKSEEKAENKDVKKENSEKVEKDVKNKAILVVSFGTSHKDTRKASIEATEEAIAKAYPEYDVKRAFTSDFIIRKIKEKEDIIVKSPLEAMEALKNDGYKEVVVQPLHIIPGSEYNDLYDVVRSFNDGSFDKLAIGRPLLYKIEDYSKAAKALETQLPETSDNKANILMGHGTHHPANANYACLDSVIRTEGIKNTYVGTVEGYPVLDDVIKKLKTNKIDEVTLMPFMVVAGDHAKNDMAGDEEDSWKSILEKEGFKVNTYLHGIGENKAFQQMYIDSINDAIKEESTLLKPLKELTFDKTNIVEGKKAVVVVSFGTSHKDTRKASIEATENAISKKYPDYDLKRAFTSGFIIKKIKEKEGIEVNNPEEAFKELIEEGYEEVLVQPLHIMQGSEYHDLLETFKTYEKGFKVAKLGRPLLYRVEDYKDSVKALEDQLPALNDNEAVVLMGHGTHHSANASYAALDSMFKTMGHENVYVGTVEGYPVIDNVIEDLKNDNIKKVTLMPFMIVAGDHAKNDMAGEEEDSWKSILEKEGFEVEIYLHGLGENNSIQEIYAKHLKEELELTSEEK